MEMDPNPPSFNLKYDIGTVPNIGEGYAKGITAAGESLSKATTGVMDVMNRNRTADDMLTTMQSTGMLSSDAYKAVAGKSLGAKEGMVGLYAGQWIADQAAKRSQALQMGQSTADIATAHAKLLDTIQAVKSGYGTAAGVNQRNLQAGTNQSNQGNTQQPGVVAPLIGPRGALPLPRGATPQIQAQAATMAGSGAAPTALGSGNIYSPGPKLGAPVPRKGTMIPPGGTIVSGTGPKGEQAQFLRYPDGTLSPIQQ
jgi:hypothetical protein